MWPCKFHSVGPHAFQGRRRLKVWAAGELSRGSAPVHELPPIWLFTLNACAPRFASVAFPLVGTRHRGSRLVQGRSLQACSPLTQIQRVIVDLFTPLDLQQEPNNPCSGCWVGGFTRLPLLLRVPPSTVWGGCLSVARCPFAVSRFCLSRVL